MSSPSTIIYNCHAHSFTLNCIPERFFTKLVSVQTLAKWAQNSRAIHWIIKKAFVAGLSREERVSAQRRLEALMGIVRFKKQQEIVEDLASYYPTGTVLVLLSMDFTSMGAGPSPVNFEQQLDELQALAASYNSGQSPKQNRLYPFVCIDPRNPDYKRHFDTYVKGRPSGVHWGMKLYPSLGYWVQDPLLDDCYAYCQEHDIPVLSHVIPKNAVYFKDKGHQERLISQAIQLAALPEEEKRESALKLLTDHPEHKGKKRYDFAWYLNHPRNFKDVLKRYPNLKLNLAHFGGDAEWHAYLGTPTSSPRAGHDWFTIIRDEFLAKPEYPNVYTDISFTVSDPTLFPLLKIILSDLAIQQKVLYGSDYFLLEKNMSERQFSMNVRGYLDDPVYWKIANANPQNYLT